MHHTNYQKRIRLTFVDDYFDEKWEEKVIYLRNKNASPLGDKFDRSMTLGKLLDNDTQLFIFISILIMTQFHLRDQENR